MFVQTSDSGEAEDFPQKIDFVKLDHLFLLW